MTSMGCINCGEAHDGGFTTEDVGPFCSQCWDCLAAHFQPDVVRQWAAIQLSEHQSVGGLNSVGRVDPICACLPCRAARRAAGG